MRFATVLPIALVAAPTIVSAAGTLGFALGTKKPDGSCKSQSDYEDDFEVLKSQSTIVRGYAASDCKFAENVLPAAKSKGFRVILGIWADTADSFNDDKKAIVDGYLKYSDQVYAVTVGSESLYRGNFTGDQLLEKIKDVKSALPKVKVGTADSWNKYQDGTADPVVKGADIILANAFSYWQGQDIKNGSASFFDDIMQALGHIQSLNSGVEFWVGETGWPTGGSSYEAASPGIQEAEQFWKEGVCGIKAWGVNVFSFEAFDEPWKPVSTGQDGKVADETHWGVWNADRTSKYDLKC
ncbi:MAG: glycoside hydrolase 3 protein [Geoglossum umbratile]|nr:MAG: glycoside hydrolase 3 protein [Geoglossum umbratile]